jgi:SNF2 family DNA or RNA helicase
MDGSTSAQNRRDWSDMFNDPDNIKLVKNSTKINQSIVK